MVLHDHTQYGLPAAARFFLSPDEGGDSGAGGATPNNNGGDAGGLDDFNPPSASDMERGRTQERVEGEKAPDFSVLGGGKRAAVAPEPPEGGKETPGAEKGPQREPEAKSAPSKTPAKEQKPPAKPPEAKKPEAKPPEATAKTPEAPEKAKEGEAAKPKIPTDAEIDALKPLPGAPTKIIKDFGEMRSRMKEIAGTSRALQAEAERLAAENAKLKESTGKLPQDVEERLKAADHFQLLFDAQNNSEFRKEYDGRIEQTTEGIFKLLETHKLKPELIQQIKDVAAQNGGDIEKWPHWATLLNAFKDPLAKQEAINAIQARREAVKARSSKLEQLSGDRQNYVKELETKDANEKKTWAKELETEALRVGAGFEPAIEKDIPEGASPEVKAAIEAHNARVGEIAKAFQTKAVAAYQRDPKAIAQMAFDSVRAEEAERQLEEANTALTREKAKTAELEAKLSKIKNAGRVAHVESPAAASDGGRKTTEEQGKVGGDGKSAFRDFMANR